MRLRWSSDAASDLERIKQYIREDNPEAAYQVVRTIYKGCMALKKFPNRGRFGREPGSRELVFTSLPYMAVYRLKGDFIEISRIWHGAQDRS